MLHSFPQANPRKQFSSFRFDQGPFREVDALSARNHRHGATWPVEGHTSIWLSCFNSIGYSTVVARLCPRQGHLLHSSTFTILLIVARKADSLLNWLRLTPTEQAVPSLLLFDPLLLLEDDWNGVVTFTALHPCKNRLQDDICSFGQLLDIS